MKLSAFLITVLILLSFVAIPVSSDSIKKAPVASRVGSGTGFSVPAHPDLYYMLYRSPRFVILRKAIRIAGLKRFVRARSPLKTVFAPTDYAFYKLARLLGYRGWRRRGAAKTIYKFLKYASKGRPLRLLKYLLKYHVVIGKKLSKRKVVRLGTLKTALGKTIFVRADGVIVDKAPKIRNARIINANYYASNGVAHIINRVLLPVPVYKLVVKFRRYRRYRRRLRRKCRRYMRRRCRLFMSRRKCRRYARRKCRKYFRRGMRKVPGRRSFY